MLSLTICILFLNAAAPGQTAAGSWTLGPNWTYNRSMSNLELARIAMQGEINKRLLNNSGTVRTARKKVVATGRTSFNSDGRHLLPGLIADQSKGTEAEKADLKNALEQALRFYENIALQKEYPANDLSFAMLYYVINNYVIFRNIDPAATDISGEPQYLVGGFYSPLFSHERALFAQLKNQLLSDKTIAGMEDRDKQIAAEMLAIYTTLMWHQFQELGQRR
ncbi:MAG: hypothetical protein OEQ28_07135, partial [Acidobacteriota bacterium]|nr:hypothetical protein [Acidobacteriota bacterium]